MQSTFSRLWDFSILSVFLPMFTKLWHLNIFTLAYWNTRLARTTYNPSPCPQLRLCCLRWDLFGSFSTFGWDKESNRRIPRSHLIYLLESVTTSQGETIFSASENLLHVHQHTDNIAGGTILRPGSFLSALKTFCTVASKDWSAVWFTTEAPELSQLTGRTRRRVVWVSWRNWSQMLSSSGKRTNH